MSSSGSRGKRYGGTSMIWYLLLIPFSSSTCSMRTVSREIYNMFHEYYV